MKIKIIHIITKLEFGGAQQNTLFTIRNLDRNLFDPVLISGKEGILDKEANKIKDAKIYFIPELVREINPLKDIIAFLKLAKILYAEKRLNSQLSAVSNQFSGIKTQNSKLKTSNIEHSTRNIKQSATPIIVHTHSSKAGILGRWAARLSGVPIIIHTFHGFGFNDYQTSFKRNFFIFLERLTGKITSHFICVSKSNIQKGKKLGIFSEKEVSLIRSGIEINKFRSSEGLLVKKLEKLGIKDNIPVVGMIACFKPQKAPLDFIKIAAKVKKEVEAKFVLVGDGELWGKIEAEIEKLDLKDDVILTGWQEDIPQILKCFDLLLLTSLWEGLPRVIPEAVASDIPVITTDVDGASEVIKDGVNGYLLKPHNIDGFSEKIVYLLKNKIVLEDFKKSGKEVLAEFDINEMVKKQEMLYFSFFKNA